MADDREDKIRRNADQRWVSEGMNDGHHERHWRDAEREVDTSSHELPKTWSSDQSGHASPKSVGNAAAKSPAVGDENLPLPRPFVPVPTRH